MRQLFRLLLILIVVMVVIFFWHTENFANPSYFGEAACKGYSNDTLVKDVSQDCLATLLLASGCTSDSIAFNGLPQAASQSGSNDTLGKYIQDLYTFAEMVKKDPASAVVCKGPLCAGAVQGVAQVALQQQAAQQQAPDAFLDY
jgi:hypothetical protein